MNDALYALLFGLAAGLVVGYAAGHLPCLRSCCRPLKGRF